MVRDCLAVALRHDERIRRGRRVASHGGRGIRESFRKWAKVVKIANQYRVPGFLNVPHPSEYPDWGYDSVEWFVHPILDLQDPTARTALIRILAKAPIDDDWDEDPPRRTVPVWFRPSPEIDVMAGKTRIGTIAEADRGAIGEMVADAARRKHVLETDAFTRGDLDQLSLDILLISPDARRTG